MADYWLAAIEEYPLLFTFFAFWLGCNIGSFLNVCIWRIPNGMSIISPPSHCPECGYAIPFYLNVPIFSWLILRGKCANCSLPISPRYIIVEALTGLVFGGLFYSVAANALPLWSAFLYFGVASCAIACAFTDCDYKIIPDKLTSFLALYALAFNAVFMPWRLFVFQTLAALAVFVFLYLFSRVARWIFKREAFGLGDVKLLGASALAVPPSVFMAMLLFACVLALVLTPFYRRLKPKMRHRAIPFGPFITISLITVMMFLEQVKAILERVL